MTKQDCGAAGEDTTIRVIGPGPVDPRAFVAFMASALDHGITCAEAEQLAAMDRAEGLDPYRGTSVAPEPAPVPTPRSEPVWPEALRAAREDHGTVDPLWREITDIMPWRHAQGVEKYSTALQTHDGRRSDRDAIQELLDCWVYVHKLRMEQPLVNVPRARERQIQRTLVFTRLALIELWGLMTELDLEQAAKEGLTDG